MITTRERYWTLGLVLSLTCMSYVDRQVLAVLMEAIKSDLSLSDTALGAIVGTAFAVFYATVAFPIARLGDTGNRRHVLGLCCLAWSVATLLCGFAQNAWHLVLSRIGVAGGEGGATPVAHGLLADLFPPERRGLVYGMNAGAAAVGMGLALAVGGYLASIYSWREVFMIVSLPGFIVTGLMYFTAAEPRLQASPAATGPAERPERFWEAMALIWKHPVFPWLFLIGVGGALTGQASLSWAPSFLIRVHHLDVATAGGWIGLALAGGVFCGNVGGGAIVDWAGSRDQRWYAWFSALGLSITLPAMIVFVLAPSVVVALVALFLVQTSISFFMPSIFSFALNAAPAERRALTSATLYLGVTMAGAGIGPLLIGVISDLLTERYGSESIRYSLLTITVSLSIGIGAALMAARAIGRMEPAMESEAG
jgi:MFS family permease